MEIFIATEEKRLPKKRVHFLQDWEMNMVDLMSCESVFRDVDTNFTT